MFLKKKSHNLFSKSIFTALKGRKSSPVAEVKKEVKKAETPKPAVSAPKKSRTTKKQNSVVDPVNFKNFLEKGKFKKPFEKHEEPVIEEPVIEEPVVEE